MPTGTLTAAAARRRPIDHASDPAGLAATIATASGPRHVHAEPRRRASE